MRLSILQESLFIDSGPKLIPNLVLESAYEGSVLEFMISTTKENVFSNLFKTIYIVRGSFFIDSSPKLNPKLVLGLAYEGSVFKLMISQTIIWNFVFHHFFCHTVAKL